MSCGLVLAKGKVLEKHVHIYCSLTALCDTCSQVLGCGEATEWSVWSSNAMRLGLADVFNDPTLLSMDTFEMKMIEKFVVLKFS